jgi:transposase
MMKPWLEIELGRVPPAGSLAEAIRYALARWPALTRFLDDGRIELDNNPVERAIRPIALGRKATIGNTQRSHACRNGLLEGR